MYRSAIVTGTLPPEKRSRKSRGRFERWYDVPLVLDETAAQQNVEQRLTSENLPIDRAVIVFVPAFGGEA